MATLYELREQKASLVNQQRAILNKSDDEKRALTSDELQQVHNIDEALDPIDDEIRRYDATREARDINQRRIDDAHEQVDTGRRTDPTDRTRGENESEKKDILDRLNDLITSGASRREALTAVLKSYTSDSDRAVIRSAAAKFIHSGAHSLGPKDRAALQVDVSASGGTLVMPEEFLTQVIMGLDEQVYLRRLATVFQLPQADSLGVPTLDADPSDSDWTTELSTGNEDTAMATGKRMLTPHPLAKRLKVSKTLLRKAPGSEQLVRNRLTFKFGVTEEKGFLTGNGADQPLGIFTASASGISTGRDVSTDNTTTAITADGLINTKFHLASQYLASPSLRWIFHRTAVRNIRKLKDGNGQYIWTQGLAGTPDTILEVPYFMSEFAPSTFTSGQYVGIIGDFSWYWIAESMRFELQRLDELYAENNQVGFIGRMEVDGMPTLEECFARVTLA